LAAKLRVTDEGQTSPAQEIVKESQRVETVTTESGRSITIKKPGVLSQFRLIEMVGGDTAQNQVYMAMALPLFWVTEIDGEHVHPPQTKRELEALIQRVEEEGISAIVEGITDKFESPAEEQEEQAKNE